MADNFGVIINGDRQVALRFDQFPTAAAERLLTRITGLTSRLAARVRAAAPDKTGKLRSTIHEAVYDDSPRKITGRVFVDGDYAKAADLEYGGKGKAFKVSAHSAKLDHVFGHKLKAPTTVAVAAFSRRSTVKSRRFERGALEEMRGEIDAGLKEALTDTES